MRFVTGKTPGCAANYREEKWPQKGTNGAIEYKRSCAFCASLWLIIYLLSIFRPDQQVLESIQRDAECDPRDAGATPPERKSAR